MVANDALNVGAVGASCLPAIEAVMCRAFDPTFGEAWSKAQCLSVLAYPGYALRGAWFGKDPAAGLAGFAISRAVAGESELLLIAVDPDHRRAGVANALMDDWMELNQEKGVTRAFLEMREDNSARSLYEQWGFRDIAIRKAYYLGKDGVARNAVTMQKLISGL